MSQDKTEQALVLREQAANQLAQIKSIESGKEYLSKVRGIQAWAKAEKQDAEMQALIAEQKLRTQRILGQLIKQGQENGEILSAKSPRGVLPEDRPPSVVSLGINHKQSKTYQDIASIPEPAFNEFIQTKKAEVQEKAAELTTAGMLRFKQELDAEKRFETDDPWSDDEEWLRSQLEQGLAVVVNQKTMKNLCQWAKENGKLARVDRFTDWGNPFELDKDGNRDEVCDSYEIYFDLKKSLQRRLPELKSKALACWCHPERCHAHHLQKLTHDYN